MNNESNLFPNNSEMRKITSIKEAAELFLDLYHDKDIEQITKNKNINLLKIDFNELLDNLKEHGKNYDKFLLNRPNQVITALKNALEKACERKCLSIVIDDMPVNISLRELSSEHVGSLISTDALIQKISDIKPQIKNAHFECRSCFKSYNIEQKSNLITEPPICDCSGRSYELFPEESTYVNVQWFKLEEPMESRTSGSTRQLKAIIRGELANPLNNLNAGDVVNIVGVLNTLRNEKTKELSFILELNNIKPIISSYQDLIITNEDEKQIIELSNDPEIFQKITNSIATSLTGHATLKKSLALQQFGAYEEVMEDKTSIRGTIHTLLIGDPGMGKSQFLKYIHNLSPKGIYTSGATSSGVGLTAATVQDEFTGGWTVQAGAIVLANEGSVCIDELDKLPKPAILALNEPMEQGSVSISKAGLNQNMNAKTSVLAAANPKYSSFDRCENVREQIQIPDSTLSRFDLVFAIEDKINADQDRKLAKDILMGKSKETKVIDQELLTKYIAYSRANYKPKLTEEASNMIVDFFVNTRQAAVNNSDGKPVTIRDMLAVKRLTIARARSELKYYADVEHAQDAILIYADALKTIGLSPETAGILSGARSQSEIEYISKAENLISEKMESCGAKLPDNVINKIIRDISEDCGLTNNYARKIYDEAVVNVGEK